MTEEIIAVVFLCNTDKTNSTGKGIQGIVDRITIIQKDVFERMAISRTASFGGICEDASQIRELYVRAINNSHYRLVLGHMSVITDDRIPNRNHAGFKYPGEKEEALLGSLKAGKLDKAVENYDAIISQALGFSYSEVYQTVMKLLFSINSVKDEIEKNLHVTLDYSVFGVDVLKYETVAQINSYYYDLFEKLTGIVEEKKNKKKENIITNVIEMINRDYRKQNICLESVAEMVNLTPAYLGRMFKEQTLKSVGEYILEKRLEEAVGMLKGNQYTINEISERVGFVSPNYFFAVFKKAYGITPGEYRNNKLSDR
jgi:AraC-like DNA-binding protein